uniref:Uncharacterized protein n=1 Tax=Macaca nemestrina TaxID=9545 RepID=A0A2K6ECH8_MACNE
MRGQTEEVADARRSGPGSSPCCYFRRPNFFPIPEKVSEAWLAVLSMVSWVVLASWSMAGEGQERGQVRQGPGNHLAWVSQGTCLGHCAQRALMCLGPGPGWGGAVGGVLGLPASLQPHQTFLPRLCGLIHHLLSCCSGR